MQLGLCNFWALFKKLRQAASAHRVLRTHRASDMALGAKNDRRRSFVQRGYPLQDRSGVLDP